MISQPKWRVSRVSMGNATSTKTCQDCRFYVSKDGLRGDCRRAAPVVVHWQTCWPVVPAATAACGEFQQRRQSKTVKQDLIGPGTFKTRVQNALRRSSIQSWGQLEELEEEDLLRIPGIGAAGVAEIVRLRCKRRQTHTARSNKGDDGGES